MRISAVARRVGHLSITGIAALCAAAGLMAGIGVTSAQALGPGKACVFIEPRGAAGLGHIGWGFEVDSSGTWVFGSTENPNGDPWIGLNTFNGAWYASGSWGDMITAFTLQTHYPATSKSPYPAAPYTMYRCEAVSNSAVTAAKNAAAATIKDGYIAGFSDCLTAVIKVLTAYNANNLPTAAYLSPKLWWNALPSNWNSGGNLGETWVNYHSGLYLDVSGPSSNNGTVIHQWTYTGADNQWWYRYAWNYGYVFTRYQANAGGSTSKCMGVGGGSMNQGAPIVEWDCINHPDQQWIYKFTGTYAGSWPVYNIIDRNSGDCLGIGGGSTSVGAAAVQWPCNGHPDQKWY